MLKGLLVKNMMRWRWRYLSVAFLLALAFNLFVLYASFTISSRSDAIEGVLDLPYDALVVARSGETILSDTELYNALPFNVYLGANIKYEKIILAKEEAVSLRVNSRYGALSLLGLEGNLHYNAETMELEGRFLIDSGEIIIPRFLAEREGLLLGDTIELSSQERFYGLRYKSFTVVGIYDGFDLQPALVGLEDGMALTQDGKINACLFTYDRNERPPYGVETDAEGLAWFLKWLKSIYPHAIVIEAFTPMQVGETVLTDSQGSEWGILALIVTFFFVGILTISVTTYLERRHEYASLKCIGISNRQISILYLLEYSFSMVLGLFLGFLFLSVLTMQINWFKDLGLASLLPIYLVAIFGLLITLYLAILYPLLTLRIASVNQLLFARIIPLRHISLDHMDSPDTELVYQERAENVRILKAYADGESNHETLFLKQVGDQVKRGETIAISESFFGYIIHEWRAFCDGKVLFIIKTNGVIIIKPCDLEAEFYAYPSYLLETEQNRRSRLKQAAREVKLEENASYEENMSATKNGQGRDLLDEKIGDNITTISTQDPVMAPTSIGNLNVTDYASIARKEQNAAVPATAKRSIHYLRPVLWLLVMVGIYGTLNYMAHYQRELIDAGIYETTLVQRGTLQYELSYAGNLQPQEVREMRLPVGGRIAEIMVDNGASIVVDQPLMRIENPEIEIAFLQAEAELAQAKIAYDILAYRNSFTSDANSELRLSLMGLQRDYQNLLQERTELNYYAPTKGTITEIMVASGEVVNTGEALLGFYNADTLSSTEKEITLLQARSSLDNYLLSRQSLEVRAIHNSIIGEIVVAKGDNLVPDSLLLTEIITENLLPVDRALSYQQALMKQENLEKQVAGLMLAAPSTGIITGLNLEKDDQVNLSTVIGQIVINQGVIAIIQVPQQDVMELRIGDLARLDNLYNGHKHEGVVLEIASVGIERALDRMVRYEVSIAIDSTESWRFISGSNVLLTSSSGREFGPYRVEAIKQETREILSQAAGLISEVFVSNGDYVQAGQTILQLINPDLELAYQIAQWDALQIRSQEHRVKVSGIVEQVFVQTGDRVQEGQLLMKLSNGLLEAEYASLSREYEQLVADRLTNERIYCRKGGQVGAVQVQSSDSVVAGQLLLTLLDPDLDNLIKYAATEVSKQEALLLASQNNPGAGELALAQLRLTQAEDKWQKAQKDLANLLILSPLDGEVFFKERFHVGEELVGQTAIATLKQGEAMSFTVEVHELQIHNFSLNMPIIYRVLALEKGDIPFENREELYGFISEISQEARVRDTGAVFEMTITIPYDERYRPGMTASMHLILQEATNALLLPTTCIYQERVEGELWDFVDLISNERRVQTRVATGMKTEFYTEIRSGLKEGDAICLR